MNGINDPIEVVREFINRINAQDSVGIFALKSSDFVFVDSTGGKFSKKEVDWEDYFAMFPDYAIRVDEVLVKGKTVVVLGSFSETYAVNGELREENYVTAPAVWKGVVEDGLISLWQVYTDHTRTWEGINRNK